MLQKGGKILTVLCFVFTALVCLVLFVGLFGISRAVDSYITATGRPEIIAGDLVRAYYFCAPVTLVGLLLMCRLLIKILAGRVFEQGNTWLLRGICWCASLASVVCFVFGASYLPLLICAVAGVFIALILAVLSRLFDAAARIKAENELTI